MAGRALVGCSGWNYPHWRDGVVYPQGLPARRWLAYYATLFDTVEVNATFYRLASPAAVRTWIDDTPDDFVFTLKASRFLTHMKRLTDLGIGVERFYAAVAPLVGTPKLGPVLWQLPERFARDDDRLARALAALPPGRHAFELRHPSWFVPAVYALLRAHDAALVVADHPQRDYTRPVRTASWAFVRFHYGRRGREGNYAPRELAAWATRLAAWRRSGDVYAYFNNDWRGYAVANARTLARLLGVARARPGRCGPLPVAARGRTGRPRAARAGRAGARGRR
jgi:uncharacterized protein YecE (DUF72 family)